MGGKSAPRPFPSPRDQDLNHIAILEDDGTLIFNVVTRTDNIVSRFYASHADDYDYLCIFAASSFVKDIQPEAGFAFETNVSNDIQGINLNIFNSGGSIAPGVTRLKSILNMNDLGEYGEDPGEALPGFLNVLSGIDVLGHEAEHMVGAYLQADNADILGRGDAHWSFFFETHGSVIEGNGWQDNGSGTSWTTIESGTGYSQLDNYLYGFLLPSQVTEPMYVINDPDPFLPDATMPAESVTVSSSGSTMVTIDNVIARNGPRSPDANSSQKIFKMAMILVTPNGSTPAARDLEKIDEFRVQWEEFFAVETNGVGTIDTEFGFVPVTADFESHQSAGPPGLTVQFDNDSSGSIFTFLWEFGDGGISTERHPLHTYTEPGLHDVTLTVTGFGGPMVAFEPGFIEVGPLRSFFDDDFETDRGWVLDAIDDAAAGTWVHEEPVGSFLSVRIGNDTVSAMVQPEHDHTPDGTRCLVTGNAGPGDLPSTQDVDNGTTSIRSPLVDLSSAINPVLSFWHWYSNNAGAAAGRDSLFVDLSSDGGNTWVRALTFHSSHHFWRQEQVRISEFVSLTSNVCVRFSASDLGAGSLVEAAVDDVKIFDVVGSHPVAIGAEDAPAGPRTRIDAAVVTAGEEPVLIRYSLSAPVADVKLSIFNVSGRHVQSFDEGRRERGVHHVLWDRRDRDGNRVARGVYLLRLRAGSELATRKLALTRK